LPKKRRTEVVGVRLSPSELKILDDMVETGLFGSRSEIAYWLITEGLKTIPVEKLSTQAERIRQARDEAREIARDHWEEMRRSHAAAFGEDFVQPVPQKGEIGWGTGLAVDEEGPIGFDWDAREIVTDEGRTRISLDRSDYTLREKKILKRARPHLETMAKTAKERENAKPIREPSQEMNERLKSIEQLDESPKP
jgi:Arc/MetJ-type ribon-helix-helix transcriptional regulator